ncbi:hypothetical protein DER45DRAFT_559868 [Fusarium avenaceum]|nr:hypothetical protein DER45DRAFT_559868 [Fusarium avenaceum]
MAGGPRSSPINQQEMADRAANTSSRRTMEDNENMRSRLADQNISILNYPDPLKPRSQLKIYPQGVTQDMEDRWHQMIEQSKN